MRRLLGTAIRLFLGRRLLRFLPGGWIGLGLSLLWRNRRAVREAAARRRAARER
jgi:hypothetical protein